VDCRGVQGVRSLVVMLSIPTESGTIHRCGLRGVSLQQLKAAILEWLTASLRQLEQ